MRDAGFLLLIAVAIGIYGAVRVAHGRVKRHGILVLAWRWLTGQPWHGDAITDRGWFRPGTKALTRTGHAPKFHHLPRWRQTVSRTGRALAVFLALIGVLFRDPVALAAACLLVAAGVGWQGWVAWRKVQHRKLRKTYLYPVHLAVAPLAGIALPSRPESWIKKVQPGVRAVLELPAGFQCDPKEEERIASTAAKRLAIEAPEAHWHRAGPVPLLTLTTSPPPPGHVHLADVLEEMAKCKDDELLIGIGKNDTPIRASLGTDSPHIAVSMGTGAGKSNLAGFLMLQMLMRGSIGLVLDAKRRLSYPWLLKDEHGSLAPLPNVAYAWTVGQIHASMDWMGNAELDRRGDVAFAGMDARGKVHANVGARLWTTAEELNLAVPKLKAYWAENRAPDDPKKSPAFTGLGAGAFAGRQVREHLVLVGQMLTAEVTGSNDSSVKEQCGIKLMARYGSKGWRIMCDDIPMPPPPTALGRIQVVTAGGAREAQVPELDPVAAREMVLAGVISPLPHDMPCKPVTGWAPLNGGGLSPAAETVSAVLPVSLEPALVSLTEAVRSGHLHPDTTVAAMRMARYRGELPDKRGQRKLDYLYDLAELEAWDAGRR